ncbi:DUF4148 domain-containing protein [Alcaligenaceae bacterium]|nr:DUF4148 domain-containing protein [Alcaligenaceae bacterium]
MKTFASLLLISATLTGTAVYAQDNQSTSVTRAQVVAELQAAKAAGQLSVGELDYPPTVHHASSVTRAEVVAELQAAIDAGELSNPPA